MCASPGGIVALPVVKRTTFAREPSAVHATWKSVPGRGQPDGDWVEEIRRNLRA